MKKKHNEGMEHVLFYRVVCERLPDEVIFEQGPEGSEGVSSRVS